MDIRRVQNPTLRLSNNQIAGYVAISSDQNPNLRDQSNREGLDDNQAFHDLRQIMHLILSRLEEPRYKARRDGSGDSKERKPSSLFASLDLSPLRQKLASALPNDKETQKLVDAVEQEFSGRIKQLQAVLSRYHRLATLGQLIDVLLHDGRHPIASIRSQALLGREDIQATDSTSSLHSQLLSRFEKIENQGNILFTVFKRVEPFGGRKRGRPAKLYLEKTIEEAIAVFSSDIQKLGIRISIPSTQTLVSVDDAEMKEVLTNLITNSLYWLEQVDKDNRQIAIEVTRGGPAHVEILFADSGPGIPLANRELIFEPYFSTKPEGVGLGLSIAGEIVSDYYDGNLELLDSGPLPGAVFRITLHKKV